MGELVPQNRRANAEGGSGEVTCPGEKYSISRAICRTRQRNQYPKCLLCPHRSEDAAGRTAIDPKVTTSIFRSTGVLGRVPQEINEYVVRKIGLAAAQFLRAENPAGSRLVVACDLRENSRGFTRIFCEGANRGGIDTTNIGIVPPELVAFALGTDGCTGGAFIGGRNYADNVNGVRLWRSNAALVGFGVGLEKIALIARRLRTGHSRLPGEMKGVDLLGDYVSYVLKFAPNLAPLKVVLDAGCGAAGRVVDAASAELPLQITPEHFDEDGHNEFLGRNFPSAALVSSVKSRVREAGADLGAAFDFDGQRIAFFDERGELLRHDAAAGLIGAEVVARTPGAAIAYDLRASAALRERIAEHEAQPLPGPATPLAFTQHFRRSDAAYGADLTGLHYFKGFFRSPSALVALLLFCSYVSRERQGVSELAADMDRYSQSGEIAISLPSGEAAQEVLEKLREEFPDAERDMIDGLSVRQPDWWFNLRQRGSTADLRLNVEGRTARDQRRGRQTVERLVSNITSSMGQ